MDRKDYIKEGLNQLEKKWTLQTTKSRQNTGNPKKCQLYLDGHANKPRNFTGNIQLPEPEQL